MTTPNKVREAFEAWAAKNIAEFYPDKHDTPNDMDYLNSEVQKAWHGYQAACADRDKVIAELVELIADIEAEDYDLPAHIETRMLSVLFNKAQGT